jgi:tripartite-type tricarboxylate transporter receptor subunit TctC
MAMNRRTWALVSAIVGLLNLSAPVAAQETYPDRPLRWIVPNPAGGGTDVVVRAIANVMSANLKQPVVVDNRPGAATMIGADALVRSKPDGYTLMVGDNATFATNVHLYRKLTYDPAKDFIFLSLTARFPLVLVARPGFPARTLSELLSHVRANPGKVNFASPGTGLPHHLAMELLMEQAGVSMTHVPYRGSPPAVQDLLAGRVDVMFLDVASGFQFIKSGQLQVYGIASRRPFETLPEVKPLSELGLAEFEAHAWQGVVLPAGTPAAAVSRLQRELQAAIKDPAVQRRMIEIGVEPITSTSEEFAGFARRESERWGRLISTKGVRLE